MDLLHSVQEKSSCTLQEAVKKNDEADPQFAQPTSSRSQGGSCMKLNTERTCEVFVQLSRLNVDPFCKIRTNETYVRSRLNVLIKLLCSFCHEQPETSRFLVDCYYPDCR